MESNAWFILEDDQELVLELKELGKELSETLTKKCGKKTTVEPIVAHCVEDAIAKAKEMPQSHTIAFIDMMVPNKVSDLAQLNVLIREREDIVNNNTEIYSKTVASGSGNSRINVRQELMKIDDKINPLIDINGGFTFLEADGIKPLISDWMVFVYSARTQPANWKERKSKIGGQIEWLQKPVDPEQILMLLATHFQSSFQDAKRHEQHC